MKFWNWLKGKKTVIAASYWTLSTTLLTIWFPAGVPSDLNKINLTIGAVFTVVGLGDKAVSKLMEPK